MPKSEKSEKKNGIHSFHVVLADGSERDVTAREASVRDGALQLHNDVGDTSVIYAPGQWKLCELERKDDR